METWEGRGKQSVPNEQLAKGCSVSDAGYLHWSVVVGLWCK